MKTTQEIFNLAISTGLYGPDAVRILCPDNKWRDAKRHMCFSLQHLYYSKQITNEEYAQADREINRYLREFGYLPSALEANSLPSSFQDRLAIYKDWENRPKLEV